MYAPAFSELYGQVRSSERDSEIHETEKKRHIFRHVTFKNNLMFTLSFFRPHF